jgi:hypothetical protein
MKQFGIIERLVHCRLMFSILMGSWYTIDQTQRGVSCVMARWSVGTAHFAAVHRQRRQTTCRPYLFGAKVTYSADQQPADLVPITVRLAGQGAEVYRGLPAIQRCHRTARDAADEWGGQDRIRAIHGRPPVTQRARSTPM